MGYFRGSGDEQNKLFNSMKNFARNMRKIIETDDHKRQSRLLFFCVSMRTLVKFFTIEWRKICINPKKSWGCCLRIVNQFVSFDNDFRQKRDFLIVLMGRALVVFARV